MNDQERATLEAFVGRLTVALELTELRMDLDQILNLAGDAAKAVVRPAAPVTTFLVGFDAGRKVGAGMDSARAIAVAIDTAVATANEK